MIDHQTARQTFAASLDFPVDGPQRHELDEHLWTCATCRGSVAAMRDDATRLAGLDLGPVPAAVRAKVALATERAPRQATTGRSVALVGVGALLIVALGGGALGLGGSGRGTAAQAQVDWRTEVVALSASEFSVTAGGKTFHGADPIAVTSDPGDATYRTLEATWHEQGVEMRLNLYFGGDATEWWVREIRTYNGAADPKWLVATGTFFKSPVGAAWSGSIDIPLGDPEGVGGLPASVHLVGLDLASRAFDGVTEPIGGGKTVAETDQLFAPGGVLHCSGILQLTPSQAEAALLKLGYRLSWRLVRTTGPQTGYAEIRPHAPEGIISGSPAVGTSGELIVFVSPLGDPMAVPVPAPTDCPVADPHAAPPAPAEKPKS